MPLYDLASLACASLTCPQSVTVVLAGVPLCEEHRRLLHADLTLPRPKYAASHGKPWFVYYITWPHEPDVVKIGATVNLQTRFYSLKRDGHFPKLLAIEPGRDGLEEARHAQFADLCLSHRGEYFRLRPSLAAHIEAILRDHPDPLAFFEQVPWWLNPAFNASSFAEVPRCGAPCSEYQQPCRRPLGYGTTHLGTGRCKHHEHIPFEQAEAPRATATPCTWTQDELFAA